MYLIEEKDNKPFWTQRENLKYKNANFNPLSLEKNNYHCLYSVKKDQHYILNVS